MKKLLIIAALFAVSCSSDDSKDCKYDQAELETRYENYFEQDLSDEQRRLLEDEYEAKLEEAC